MSNTWRYSGQIFDAHTHIGTINEVSRMIAIEDVWGISKQIAIVHNEEGMQFAKEKYPNRFIFAKYLSLKDIANYNVEPILNVIAKLRDQGYSLAKSWFGPRWRDWVKVPKDFRINHPQLEPIYDALENYDIPLIIHMGDPDTYYATQYKDSEKYGTKEDHLNQLKDVITQHPKLKFQIPHFGAQPEIHRLSELSKWMDNFPNMIVDTASSRWMARELSKDPKKAREFMLKYSDRILFGTDIESDHDDLTYFSGRYEAQRILWETNNRGTPLPFPDADTVDIGGTVINGLDLPLSVLEKLYWENANRLYPV